MSEPVTFKPLEATTEAVAALLPDETDSFYLTARFTTDNVDSNTAEQGLAILASPSPTKAGYAVKVPAYRPAGGGMRDTSIWYWKGRYYVAYTAGFYGEVTYFTVIGSDDLVDWAHVADVPVNMGSHTWGPEFYEEDGVLYVLIGANTSWPADSSFYLLHALDDGLTTWSAPTVLTGFSNPVNDSCLRKIGSTYHLVGIEAVSGGYLEFWTASNKYGPYTKRLSGNHSGWGANTEGPCLTHLGGTRWMLTADFLNSTGVSYYAISEDNMATWGPQIVMDLPKSLRHGSTIRLQGYEHFRKLAIASLSTNGNLNHRALESSDFENGVPAALPYADANRWAAFGYKKNVGWFLANRNEYRAGDGSYGSASEDQFRSGYAIGDPCSVLTGGADNSVRSALGGVVKTIPASAQSVTTTPTDLHSYTVPASALNANGDSLVFKTSGRFSAGAANVKECKLYVNGTEVATTGSSAFNATAFQFHLTITRRSATTVHLLIEGRNGAAVTTTVVDATITLAGAFIIKTVGIGGVTGDVKSDCSQAIWFPAQA